MGASCTNATKKSTPHRPLHFGLLPCLECLKTFILVVFLDPLMGKFEIFKTHNQVKPSISRKSMEYEVIITTKDHDLDAILSYFFSLWTVFISVMYEFSRCSTKWMGISRRAGEFDVSLPEAVESDCIHY